MRFYLSKTSSEILQVSKDSWRWFKWTKALKSFTFFISHTTWTIEFSLFSRVHCMNILRFNTRENAIYSIKINEAKSLCSIYWPFYLLYLYIYFIYYYLYMTVPNDAVVTQRAPLPSVSVQKDQLCERHLLAYVLCPWNLPIRM